MAQINIDPAIYNNRKPPFKKWIQILIAIIVVSIGVFALQKMDILPKFQDWFKSTPLKIDNSPLVLTGIRDLSELTTITTMAEVVVNEYKEDKSNVVVAFFENMSLDPKMCKLTLIVKGKIRVGINLSNLTKKNLKASNDTVSMKIPHATFQDVIVNPSDVKIFREKGKWTNYEVQRLTEKAKEKIKDLTLKQNIIVRAEKKAEVILKGFLRNSGYTVIDISFN